MKSPRIMISAISSGSGKTTITCSILKALKDAGKNVASFKCGPDYIDPMFHSEVLGVNSSNLDLFLTSENTCKYLLSKNSINSDISIIEGVMGYYDGISTDTLYSSYHIAKVTNTPVILVVNCKGMSCTVGAIINGIANFRSDSNIKGVILNNTSEKMYPIYKEIIERETNVAVFGYLPSLPECNFESRHLGLITTQELEDIDVKLQKLANVAGETIDIDGLIKLANTATKLEYENIKIQNKYSATIAVAKDKAFCFYYKDALELLSSLGAKIIYFSPLSEKEMPKCDGFILGGGYPEIYLDELSKNKSMLADIKAKIESGIPYIAECGGFMYLFDAIEDFNMVGSISGEVFMTKKLSRFGYVTLTANKDNLLCNSGETINAHEFHYSDTTNNGSDFTAKKPYGNRSWGCIIADEQRFIGYPHINFLGNIKYAENFLNKCQFNKRNDKNG